MYAVGHPGLTRTSRFLAAVKEELARWLPTEDAPGLKKQHETLHSSRR